MPDPRGRRDILRYLRSDRSGLCLSFAIVAAFKAGRVNKPVTVLHIEKVH